MLKKILKFFLPLLILGAGIGGYLYLVKTKPLTEPVTASENAWMVATQRVELQSLSPTLTLYGRTESPHAVTLRSAISAEVLETGVLEGQPVAQGQVLARLDERDVGLLLAQRQADLAEIEAGIASENNLHANHLAALPREQSLLDLAEKGVARVRELEKQRLGSQSALDEARQAVERQTLAVNARQLEIKNHGARLAQLEARKARAAALLAQAGLDVSRAQITAPFAGIVAKLQAAPGDRLRPGDPVLSLYGTAALEVRAQIPATYQRIAFDLLAAGESLRAQAEVAGHPVELRLHRLAGEVKADSGGIDGLFRVAAGGEFLRLGQFLEVRLILPAQAGAVALPFEAVYGSRRIYKLVDERMVKVEVERLGEQAGENGQTRVLVRSPELHPGDSVIVTQLPNAIDGLKVTAWQGEAKSSPQTP